MLVNHPILTKLMCVALVVAVMFPTGRMLFPMIGQEIGETPYGAIEGLLSASLGFGLYTAFFS